MLIDVDVDADGVRVRRGRWCAAENGSDTNNVRAANALLSFPSRIEFHAGQGAGWSATMHRAIVDAKFRQLDS
jgi:hypothetical protein